MDYAAHYDRLIARARGRVIDGYSERHHVLPRCLGGKDSKQNIVRLTAAEHYIAHQLLVRIHPHNGRLVHAAVWMAKRCSGSRAYAWLRKRHAAAVSKNMKGNKSWLGKKHTDEWKAARSAAMTGKKMPADGVEKMAATKRGKRLSAEHCAQISAVHRGVAKSAEHKAKISAAHLGLKTITPDGRKRISNANRARVFTDQVRENMSAAHRGKKRGPCPPEVRAKIAAGHRRRLGLE